MKIFPISALTLLMLTVAPFLKAQEDVSEPTIKFSGYAETYYVYDFGGPENHDRPAFLYSFNRHNEVSLNFAYLMAEYSNERTRGTFALATGTYMNANYAAEPGTLQNIFEANAGVKISKEKNIWVDAGVFASHIGFESAIGAICFNMTRSLLAENSPYFLSGAKITYTSDDEKWLLSGLILNGWQRIQRVPGNQLPGFGHQLTYTPSEKLTFNSSSFVGSDFPDSLRQMRYFHNFYGIYSLTEKLSLITGFDIGAEQKAKGATNYNIWYSPVLVARYDVNEKLSLAGRVEHYNDAAGVIIPTATANGFQTTGYSANLDVKVSENVLWRFEARSFNSRDKIFIADNKPSNTNSFLGTSLSVKF